MEQLEPGGPALGPGLQGGDLVGAEVEVHHPAEELPGLLGREPQVGGAQFGDVASRAQPRKWKERVGAA